MKLWSYRFVKCVVMALRNCLGVKLCSCGCVEVWMWIVDELWICGVVALWSR